jgi:PKD repeat protein
MYCPKILSIATTLSLLTLVGTGAYAQCPDLIDADGISSSTPTWYSCNPGDYDLFIQTSSDWSDVTVNWGDGTSDENLGLWTAGNAISHNYPAVWNIYTLTFTSDAGCVITGEFIKEESVTPSITIPEGWATDACAPATLNFMNSSTNVSSTTTFTWEFDDGITVNFDHTNAGEAVPHNYSVGSTGCNREVTLVATNACRNYEFGTGASVMIDYINIWDIDNAAIGASSTQLCYPDTTVLLSNNTEKNCTSHGNNTQRFEMWNFGDLDSDGVDEIIDWRPWTSSDPFELDLPGVGTYLVMLYDSSYCGIDSTQIELIVRAPLSTNLSGPNQVCEGLPATFVQDENDATAFYWNFNDGVGQWYPGGSPSLTWTFNDPGNYAVLGVVALSGQATSCHDTARFEILVKPSPQVIIELSQTEGCDSFSAIAEETSGEGVNYDWTFNVAPGTHNGTTTPELFFDSPGSYVVGLEVTGANGCVRTANVIPEVFESPTADFINGLVCEGDSTSFTDLSLAVGGDQIQSWSWSFGDGSLSEDQHPTHLYNSPGEFDVNLEISTAHCNNIFNTSVDVEPSPTISTSSDVIEGCTPLLVNFEAFSDVDANVVWNFGDGLGSEEAIISHTYLSQEISGTTFIAVANATSPFGCIARDTIQIATLPGAQASFYSSEPSCAPMEAIFTNNSSSAISYFWDFTDGVTSMEDNPMHTFENTTGFLETFPVRLVAIAENGCNDTTIVGVSVYPEALFDFILPENEGCSPFAVQMPPLGGALDIIWSFGDGTPDSDIPMTTHVYTNETEFAETHTLHVEGTSNFGCIGAFSTEVSVNPQPIAQFSTDIQVGCAPLSVNFSDNSERAINLTWIYGDGGEENGFGGISHEYTFEHQGMSTVIREVTLLVEGEGGCIDTEVVAVELYPEVVTDFLVPPSSCSPLNVLFVNQSLNANAGFTWNFGDGSPESPADQPTHVFVTPGFSDTTFTVTLSGESVYGCSGTKSVDLEVLATPVADVEITNMIGCYPLEVTFTNASQGADNIEWYYGTGEISNESATEHVFHYFNPSNEPVTYNAVITATTNSGCSAQDQVQIEVLPEIEAAFDVPQQGCSPFNVSFLNTSSGASAYNWNFGDGLESDSFEPTHTFNTPFLDQDTTFTISLTVTSSFGCTDTVRTNIEVYAAPHASFTVTPIIQIFPDVTVDIENTTLAGISSSTMWNFGDGSISTDSEPIGHTFDTWGTYNIALDVSNGYCADNSSQSIQILAPSPEISFMGGGEGCAPLTIDFTNFSQYADEYRWDFGDGTTHAAEHPSHTFELPGTYDIKLEVYGYDGTVLEDIHYATVVVYPKAQAAFTLTPTEIFAPGEPIYFMNVSADATEYLWSFGDGATSTSEHPIHEYTGEGIYTVSLTADNEWGCSTTFTLAEAVLAKPGGIMTFPTAFTPLTGGGTGGSYDPQSYDNNVFRPLHSGIIEYELFVFNKLGEQIFYSSDVNIGWDGYVNGELAPQEVYAYKAVAMLSDGRKIQRAGTITLMVK